MTNNNLFFDHIEKIIVEYNVFLNFVIGLVAFSLGITALLSKEYASSVASLTIIFLLICIITKQVALGNIVRSYYKDYTFFDSLLNQLKFNLPFHISFLFLGSIAFGLINIDSFIGFSFEHLFK